MNKNLRSASELTWCAALLVALAAVGVVDEFAGFGLGHRGLSAAVAEAKAQKAAGKEGTKAAEASLESAKAALKNRLNQVVADKTMH